MEDPSHCLEMLLAAGAAPHTGRAPFRPTDGATSCFGADEILYKDESVTCELARAIAWKFAGDDVQVVVTPSTSAAVILTLWLRRHLNERRSRVIASYHLIRVSGEFSFHKDSPREIAGKRVLIADVCLITPHAVRAAVRATHEAGGKVVGVGIAHNCGRVTPREIGIESPRVMWSAIAI